MITLYLKACPCLNTTTATPSVFYALPLVSLPLSWSITSSHSEANDGMRSMRWPERQLDTDPLRPASPPSSSPPKGDANKSESDLDKLRISPRSAGLALTAATDVGSVETSLGLSMSASRSWITVASCLHSAIVLELQNCSSGSSVSWRNLTCKVSPESDPEVFKPRAAVLKNTD